MSWVFTAVAVVTAVSSNVQANKARSDRRNAAKTQAKQEALSNRQSRIEALAAGRVARSQQLSGAEASGTSGGSGVAAAVGSTQSQTYNNIGFQNTLMGLNQRRVDYLNSASRREAQSQTYQTVSSFASFAGNGTGNIYKDIGKGLAQQNTAAPKTTGTG